jgi:hypothetical protein
VFVVSVASILKLSFDFNFLCIQLEQLLILLKPDPCLQKYSVFSRLMYLFVISVEEVLFATDTLVKGYSLLL